MNISRAAVFILSITDPMKYFVWFLVVALVILHQDYWQWHRSDLVFGFLPYPLTYHMGISIATAIVWILAVKFCWPESLKETDKPTKSPLGENE